MKAFLLDMDGVVLDSEIIYLRASQSYLQKLGIEARLEDLLWQLGLSGEETHKRMVEQFSIPHSYEEYIASDPMSGWNRYDLVEDLQPMEGLLGFLDAARAQGFRLGLCSSTYSRSVLSVVNRFGLVHRLDAIVCGDMLAALKPAPEGYLKTAAYVGAAPAECIVIEDSSVGITAGRAAGMHVIGFTGGSVEQDISQAHESCGSFAQLQNRLPEFAAL